MSRLQRIAIAFVLAFALPIQGIAAQAMLFCGPGHHGDFAVAAVATPAHHHDAADPGEHHAQHQAAKPTGGKCSACAACCIGSALAAAATSLPVVALTPVYGVASFEPHVGTTAGGLERPPRMILA